MFVAFSEKAQADQMVPVLQNLPEWQFGFGRPDWAAPVVTRSSRQLMFGASVACLPELVSACVKLSFGFIYFSGNDNSYIVCARGKERELNPPREP